MDVKRLKCTRRVAAALAGQIDHRRLNRLMARGLRRMAKTQTHGFMRWWAGEGDAPVDDTLLSLLGYVPRPAKQQMWEGWYKLRGL